MLSAISLSTDAHQVLCRSYLPTRLAPQMPQIKRFFQ